MGQLSGTASLTTALSGNVSRPDVEFETEGQGIATISKNHSFSLGHFQGVGRYSNGNVRLDRAYFDTPEGLISARGTLGNEGGLGLTVTARGVLLAAYDPRFGGQANLAATVTGTLKNPLATGRVEGYNVAYKNRTVPAVAAKFQVDRQRGVITELEAARGTASLTGFGNVHFKSGQIDGSLAVRDVQLADWLGDEYIGAIDAPVVHLSGTLAKPQLSTEVRGTSLFSRGLMLNSLQAHVETDGNLISFRDLSILGADGKVSASGSYDLSQKSGAIQASVAGLSLDKLLPELSDSIVLQGKISAHGTVGVRDLKLSAAKVEGDLSGVTLNGTLIGSGPWNVGSDGHKVSGELMVSSANRVLSVKDFLYEPETNRSAGQVHVENENLQNVVVAAQRYLPGLSIDAKDAIQGLDGLINVTCKFDGTPEDPGIDVANLEIPHMTFRKEPIGTMKASFALSHHRWDVRDLNLSGGPALVSARGSVDERGDMHIEANNDNRFDLSRLSLLDPRLSWLSGTAHLWFTADGPIRSPRIEASLSADNLFQVPSAAAASIDEDKNLRFELHKIIIDPSLKGFAGAQITGEYFYKGFTGSIAATLPFEYPFEIPSNRPLTASITLDKSDLKDIAPLLGGLDTARTDGTVAGALQLSGTTDSLRLGGGLDLAADNVAFIGVDDALKSVKARLEFLKDQLSVKVDGVSSRGGTLAVSASTPIQDLGDMLGQARQNGATSLLDRPLGGHISLKDVRLSQQLFAKSSVAGTASSEIDLAGTLHRPSITGNVAVADGNFVLNGFPASSAQTELPMIDPSFSLKVKLSDAARVRASTADIYLLGGGLFGRFAAASRRSTALCTSIRAPSGCQPRSFGLTKGERSNSFTAPPTLKRPLRRRSTSRDGRRS